jgi:hypothetical protein
MRCLNCFCDYLFYPFSNKNNKRKEKKYQFSYEKYHPIENTSIMVFHQPDLLILPMMDLEILNSNTKQNFFIKQKKKKKTEQKIINLTITLSTFPSLIAFQIVSIFLVTSVCSSTDVDESVLTKIGLSTFPLKKFLRNCIILLFGMSGKIDQI